MRSVMCYTYIHTSICPQWPCIQPCRAVRADKIKVRLPEQASRRYRERLQFYTDCTEPPACRRGEHDGFHALTYLDIIKCIRRLCDGSTGS